MSDALKPAFPYSQNPVYRTSRELGKSIGDAIADAMLHEKALIQENGVLHKDKST